MGTKILWGLRIKDFIIIILFYLLFSVLYYTTLWISWGGESGAKFFSILRFIDTCGLQYSIFLISTVPIWLLIFIKLKPFELYKRLLAHLVTLPIFVFGTQWAYYRLSDYFSFGHLEGSAAIWDIYIPTLFYIIQFGIFHAYEHYKENQRKLILEGELRQAALKSELAAIKAQLNPHFLYNVFNTINASIPPENEKTRNMIGQLSDLFRYQLMATKKELVTLGEELKFVQKYLALEKERFHDRLHINIKVSQNLMEEKIPPMLLQPLVENSVKHGLSSLIEGGSISLYIFKENDRLKFEISDTGIGIKDKEKAFNKGVGLTNTRLRLEKIYETPLELLDNYPKGLTVKFAI